MFEDEHNDEESRWLTLGIDSSGALLVVHHTFTNVDEQNCSVRIISARRTTKPEARQYETSRIMKEEYDFSQGERGKFYKPDVELRIPVYLRKDIAEFMQKLAEEKGTDVETIVNDWLQRNISLVETAK